MAGKKDAVTFIERFNHNMKLLTRDLARRYPSDPMVYRMAQRVITIIDLDPVTSLRHVGPYLYTYRDEIYGYDEKNTTNFFMANTFDDEMNSSTNSGKVEMVRYIIPKAKEAMLKMTSTEKNEYVELVVSLLDDYIEFLALELCES